MSEKKEIWIWGNIHKSTQKKIQEEQTLFLT